MIVALMTYIENVRCGVINDVKQSWDHNMNVVKQSFGKVVDFWRIMIYGQEKRSQTHDRIDFAYKVHDAVTTLSTDIEKALQTVKTKTENIYRNIEGYFRSKSKTTHPSFFNDFDKRKKSAFNTTTRKRIKTLHPILQNKEIEQLYQNTPIEVTLTNKVNYSTFQSTSSPKKVETDTDSWQSVLNSESNNANVFLLKHNIKSKNNARKYSLLRKTDMVPEISFRNREESKTDEVTNTSLKHGFDTHDDTTEHSTLQSNSNRKYPFLDLNDYLSQDSPYSKKVKVEVSLFQHSSDSENEEVEPLIEKDELHMRTVEEELSTLQSNLNLDKYVITTSPTENSDINS